MKKAVHIGKMDRRIDVIKRNKTRSSTGAEIFTESILISVWAEKKVLKSEEDIDDKVVTINEYQYMIRYDPDLAAQKIQHLYIRDGIDEFDIYGFDPIGRKQFLKIDCEKRE